MRFEWKRGCKETNEVQIVRHKMDEHESNRIQTPPHPDEKARYTGGFHNATKIPKKGETQYSGPSITNPNTTVILRDQRNTLGNFLGQTG